MKNKLMLVAALMLIGFSTVAQSISSNDFILLNNNWNMNRTYYNYYSPNLFGWSQRNLQNHEVSIQYIKSIKNNRAVRFSLGMHDHYYDGSYNSQLSNDTLIESYKNFEVNMPKIGLGIEWRKILHKDVMIIGGLDAELGAGQLSSFTTNQVFLKDTIWGGYTFSGYSFGSGESTNDWGFYAALRPFMGVRISWGRMAFDYSATLPYKYDTSPGSDAITNLDLRFQHSVSVGYRIFDRKKKLR